MQSKRCTTGQAAAALLAVLLTSAVTIAAAQSKAVAPGAKWVVAETATLSELTIGEGAAITAPENRSVTMTVDGVEMDARPGVYHGKIVFTVTDRIDLKMAQAHGPIDFRTALYVNNGKVIPQGSVQAGITGGWFTDTEAKDISIVSNGEKFNGIIVAGDSRYTIDNATIELTGNGGNDMAGWGAAVLTTGKADLTLNHARIVTKGAIRNALFVSGNSTVHINDSDVEAYSGVVPPGTKSPWDGGSGSSIMEVPWMLGLSGNVRATNVIEGGTVYYNNSHFKAQGWGALSADAPTHIRMFVTNSTIETLESGYGAFTIGDSLDTFSHCTFKVADVGLIVTGFGSALISDGTVITSRRFGIMMHTNDGKFGTVTINKDSRINSRSTAIEIKGRGVKLDVDHAAINPGNGILIEAIPNDDPFVGGAGSNATTDAILDGTPGSEKILGMGMAPGAGPSAGPNGPGGAPGGPGGPGGPSAAPIPGGPGMGDVNDSGGKMSGPVLATFRNTTLSGDIVNARTNQGGMEISLETANLTGAITTAHAILTSKNTPNGMPVKESYYLMGEVKNIFAPTHEKYGLKVSVDGTSKWVIDQTSYLTELDLAQGGTISAPNGFNLTMTVDGAPTRIAMGNFKGKVVLQVTPQ